MKKFLNYGGLVILILLSACNFLKKENNEAVVARVHDTNLSLKELKQALPQQLNAADSALFANQYINDWATKHILKHHASLNLSEAKIAEINRLTAQYKLDLYTNAYLDVLITQQLDTTIHNSDLLELYDNSSQNFKLNEELWKFRYITVSKENNNLEKITESFKNFNQEDQYELDSISIQFQSFMLNDSTWIKKSQALKKLPILDEEENKDLLKKSNFVQLEDSLRVYLVHINDLLRRNDTAPLDYVKPTLKQIVLNKRKLKLIKQIEIEIRKDAEQKNKFEVYR